MTIPLGVELDLLHFRPFRSRPILSLSNRFEKMVDMEQFKLAGRRRRCRVTAHLGLVLGL